MKISKENHKRTAVVVKTASTGGVLYKVPGYGLINLQGDLSDRNIKTLGLYNMFIPVQTGKEPSAYKENSKLSPEENKKRKEKKDTQIRNFKLRKSCEKYVGKVNKTVKSIVYPSNRVENDATILEKMKETLLPPFSGKLSDFVVIALRKSLVTDQFNGRPFDSRQAVVVFLNNIGKETISAQDEKTIKTLMALIRSDYSKWDPNSQNSYGAKAVRSIEHQNMVIQPKKGQLSLSVISDTGKQTETKRIEKSGLESFMLEYAQLDQGKREESLRCLRRLVDTYFAAPKSYTKGETVVLPEVVDTTDFSPWQRHEEAKKADEQFVLIPKVLSNAERENIKLDTVTQKTSVEKLKANIRKRNITCYRFASAVAENKEYRELFFADPAINQYWIHHIENAVERVLKKCDVGTLFKLRVGYLSEKVWKDAINLLSIKYIALGKSVYHFALDDLWNKKDTQELGKIKEGVGGITSFDYELIKAQEDLQRELAVSVAFSANNLVRATCSMDDLADKESDFLLWKKGENGTEESSTIAKNRKYSTEEELLAAILQFFGGMSSWEKDDFKKAYDGKEDYAACFLDDLRKAVYAVRNESFHFKTAALDSGSWNTELFGSLFEKEAKTCLTVEKDKFYSNNLAIFYKQSDLGKVLDQLYGKEVSRASQVPSYNTILPRKALPDFLINELGYTRPAYSADVMDQWYSACYYLFKEAYYNLFLQSPKAEKLFGVAVNGLEAEDEKQANAVGNFQERYNVITERADVSLAEICQTFMTDYNQQNNQKRKVRTANAGPLDKPIYQHYKVLLKKSLVAAFAEYIKGADFLEFVKNPLKQTLEVSQEEFLPNWTSAKYKKLTDKVKTQPELQKWYIVGKFMNAKTLNLLLGSMRSYLQYVGDVQKRAQSISSSTNVEAQNVDLVSEWIKVLEVCLLLSARTSNEFTDYYKNKEEYATYLENYVDFRDAHMTSEFEALRVFSENNSTDLYMDAENPKVNRNMIQAKLYAPDSILAKVVRKISEEEIQDFYRQKDQIADSKNKGNKVTWDEQQKILDYQKLKNRVELRDLAEYGELINELLGQLINWSFMRERDLLYFQLGFHYNCLLNNSEKPEGYKKINNIDNAILHQIIAMYVNGYPVYATDDSGKFVGDMAMGGAGGKIGRFCKYSEDIGVGKGDIYDAGLELFENVHEHDNVVELRNKIDHFKYYQGQSSMLSLYGEIFDRFFTYDMKYQKNVLNLLENLLLRHNVIIKPEITTGTKKVGTRKKEIRDKECAVFKVSELSSDLFTYKVAEGEKQTAAKNELYLETVRKILYYPDAPERKNKGKKEKGGQVIYGESKPLENNPFAAFNLSEMIKGK